jgi:hypothetical protein
MSRSQDFPSSVDVTDLGEALGKDTTPQFSLARERVRMEFPA